jgi:hypothetical protein
LKNIVITDNAEVVVVSTVIAMYIGLGIGIPKAY